MSAAVPASAGARPPPCLGPFQDNLINLALKRIGEAAEREIRRTAAAFNVDPEDLRAWIARDAVTRLADAVEADAVEEGAHE